MKYTNSSLASYMKLSPNHSGKRTHTIDRITPHCVVGQASVETICGCFDRSSVQASCNYGIGTDGKIGLCVEEKNRSWCSSSNSNDQRAVTVECASDATAPYAMTDAVYASLINLCIDICKRYNKKKLLWLGDKEKTLAYEPAANEMVLTVHRWFANKSCPGDWLYNRLGDLATRVTAALGGDSNNAPDVIYRVQVGAFTKKENANVMLTKLKEAGFGAYVVQTSDHYKIQIGTYRKKTNADTIIAELKKAGYDAFLSTEQTEQNENTNHKNADEIAQEVIRGDWGSGADRKKRLEAAGYNYAQVQAAVNILLSIGG